MKNKRPIIVSDINNFLIFLTFIIIVNHPIKLSFRKLNLFYHFNYFIKIYLRKK